VDLKKLTPNNKPPGMASQGQLPLGAAGPTSWPQASRVKHRGTTKRVHKFMRACARGTAADETYVDALLGRRKFNCDFEVAYGIDTESGSARVGAPLHVACVNGNTSIVKKLLAAGASPDFLNRDGTSLVMASMFNRRGVVRALLRAGADLERVGQRGMTALNTASAGGNLAIVKMLVGKGASVGSVDHEGLTTTLGDQLVSRTLNVPLLSAAMGGYVDVMHFLAWAGATCTVPIVDGATDSFVAAADDHMIGNIQKAAVAAIRRGDRETGKKIITCLGANGGNVELALAKAAAGLTAHPDGAASVVVDALIACGADLDLALVEVFLIFVYSLGAGGDRLDKNSGRINSAKDILAAAGGNRYRARALGVQYFRWKFPYVTPGNTTVDTTVEKMFAFFDGPRDWPPSVQSKASFCLQCLSRCPHIEENEHGLVFCDQACAQVWSKGNERAYSKNASGEHQERLRRGRVVNKKKKGKKKGRNKRRV